MISAAQSGHFTTRFFQHTGSPVTTNVEEGSENPFLIADYKDRLAGNIRGEEGAGLGQLVEMAGHLPGIAEDKATFGRIKRGVPVPQTGDSVCSFER